MRILILVMVMMLFSKVKINGSSEEMLAFAAEMFGDKSTEEVGWSSLSNIVLTPPSAPPTTKTEQNIFL